MTEPRGAAPVGLAEGGTGCRKGNAPLPGAGDPKVGFPFEGVRSGETPTDAGALDAALSCVGWRLNFCWRFSKAACKCRTA